MDRMEILRLAASHSGYQAGEKIIELAEKMAAFVAAETAPLRAGDFANDGAYHYSPDMGVFVPNLTEEDRETCATLSSLPPAPPLPEESAAYEPPPAEAIAAIKAAEVKGAPPAKRNRSRKRWAQDELEFAGSLLDRGLSYDEVGRIMGRSYRSIKQMRSIGAFPVKVHTLSQARVLASAMGHIDRGRNLSTRTIDRADGKNL